MKKVLLGCIAAGLLSGCTVRYYRHGFYPAAGKVYAEYEYHYYPDLEIYWYPASREYVVLRDNAWVTVTVKPEVITKDYTYVIIKSKELKPWKRHSFYRNKYPRGRSGNKIRRRTVIRETPRGIVPVPGTSYEEPGDDEYGDEWDLRMEQKVWDHDDLLEGNIIIEKKSRTIRKEKHFLEQERRIIRGGFDDEEEEDYNDEEFDGDEGYTPPPGHMKNEKEHKWKKPGGVKPGRQMDEEHEYGYEKNRKPGKIKENRKEDRKEQKEQQKEQKEELKEEKKEQKEELKEEKKEQKEHQKEQKEELKEDRKEQKEQQKEQKEELKEEKKEQKEQQKEQKEELKEEKKEQKEERKIEKNRKKEEKKRRKEQERKEKKRKKEEKGKGKGKKK